MRIKASPLILKDFFILKSTYSFVETKKNKLDIEKLFGDYVIDLDFIAREQEGGDIFIFVKVHINDIAKPLAGYSLFVEGVANFRIDEDAKLSEKEASDLVYISGLSIAINNLRSYIKNMTMYFPFGRFVLPAIDIGDLHAQKRAELEKAGED